MSGNTVKSLSLAVTACIFLGACGRAITPAGDAEECSTRTVYVQVPLSEPPTVSVDVPEAPAPVINIEAPEDDEEATVVTLTHRGSVCNATIVSVDNMFFALYNNTLIPVHHDGYTYIRTIKVGSVNHQCSAKINEKDIPVQRMKEL